MIVPIKFGSVVGMGCAANVGAQAMTSARAVNQSRYFILRDAIFLMFAFYSQREFYFST
jgi:hypothetical protein